MTTVTNKNNKSGKEDKNFGLIQMIKETKLSVYALLIVGAVLALGSLLLPIHKPLEVVISIVGLVLIFVGGFRFRRQWGSPEPGYLYGAYGATPDVREEQERDED